MRFRSLPKLSSQDEEGGAGHPFGGGLNHFEPIPHDHDFCERVVINVSSTLNIQEIVTSIINYSTLLIINDRYLAT